ncbi:hypothetical protein P7C73_g4264, partial [Tremellales sp. Uapishka_1]
MNTSQSYIHGPDAIWGSGFYEPIRSAMLLGADSRLREPPASRSIDGRAVHPPASSAPWSLPQEHQYYWGSRGCHQSFTRGAGIDEERPSHSRGGTPTTTNLSARLPGRNTETQGSEDLQTSSQDDTLWELARDAESQRFQLMNINRRTQEELRRLEAEVDGLSDQLTNLTAYCRTQAALSRNIIDALPISNLPQAQYGGIGMSTQRNLMDTHGETSVRSVHPRRDSREGSHLQWGFRDWHPDAIQSHGSRSRDDGRPSFRAACPSNLESFDLPYRSDHLGNSPLERSEVYPTCRTQAALPLPMSSQTPCRFVPPGIQRTRGYPSSYQGSFYDN